MAALNFPNSPSTNDLHTENGVTFKWNGTIWKRVSSAYTDATNLNVTGISTFTGNIDANGDLDVDGHTNLDNVSIAGVTTTGGNVNIAHGTGQAHYQITQTNGNTVKFGIVSGSDIELSGSSNNSMYFKTNNTERVRITSSGDVGIGYNSPTVKLHVREGASGFSGTYDNRYHIVCENSGEAYLGFYVPDNSYAGIRFHDTTGAEGYIDYYMNDDAMHFYSTGNHIFKAGGTERLRIDSSGRNIINSTSNGSRAISGDHANLQVEKNSSGLLSLLRTSNDNGAAWLAIAKSRSAAGAACQAGDNIGAIAFTPHDGTDLNHHAAEIRGYVDTGIGSNDTPGYLTFHTNGGTTTTTERLRITSDGKIGINVTAPATTLHLDSTGTPTTIQIDSDTESSIDFNDHGGSPKRYKIGTNITDNSGQLEIKDMTANAERLRINTSGKVGLGVADPKSLLHIYGPGDLRIGSVYGGVALIALQVSYSSGYTGTHFMVEITDQASYSFEGSHIVHGQGGSSYGTEVTVVRMQASREAGAANSGDTWRNGTVKYNNNFTAHDQVGLNPGAGTFSFTYDDTPDGAGSTRSIQKMSFSASGQGVGVWAKMQGVFTWAAASTNGRIKIKDKDGNVLWDSNP